MKISLFINIILFTLLLLPFSAGFAQSTGNDYEQTIEQADKYFEEGDFINAKASYQYASKLRPEEEYPKEKLQESIELIKVQLQKNQQYAQKTMVADELFSQGDYPGARKVYEQALEILPDEKHARARIEEIDSLVEEQKRIEEGYANSIRQADAYFDSEDYEKALEAYKVAATFKPGESYPAERIEETRSLLEVRKANLDEYENALALAEQFVEREKYDEALIQLNRAATLKPGEPLPEKRLEEVKALKKEFDAYTALVSQGDELYINKEFDRAKEKYKEALAVNPDDDYVKNLIDRIDVALAEEADLNRSSYELAISRADELFSQEDYENALKEYKKALTFKPDAKYALQKIEEVNGMVSFRQTQEEAYSQTIARADQLYKEENYTGAREEFVKARELKPLEQYPKVKIDEIDDILEQIKTQKETYDALIAGADKLFYADDYEEARDQYRRASEMFPDKQYPLDQITMINEILGMRDTYMKSLTRADQLMAEQKYAEALLEYREASKIDPEQSYPQEKIQELEVLMADQAAELDNRYNGIIATADRQFENREYEAALATYREALELKPGEAYPQERIQLINENIVEIARQQELDRQYEDALAAGGLSVREKNYQEALASFRLAAELKPAEELPRQRIEEVNALIEEMERLEALNQEYEPVIAEADRLFSSKKYYQALDKYKEASGIKPGEDYPKERITVTEGIIAELELLNELQAMYGKLVLSADSAFDAGDYGTAISFYNKAAELMPEETYPQQRIAEIRKMEEEQRAREEGYAMAISLGDQYFDNGEYAGALEEYQTALNLKPGSEYVAKRIETINGILDELAEEQRIRQEYEGIIENADGAFEASDYAAALELYRSAAALMPGEIYPQEKIRETELLIDEIAAAEARDIRYNRLIGSSDSLYDAGEYELALSSYKSALEVKPGEQHPSGRVTEIEVLLAEIAQAEQTRKQYEEAIATADGAFERKDYNKALDFYKTAAALLPDEPYPAGKISELTLLLEEIAKTEATRKQYDETIAKADLLFEEMKFTEALAEYRSALELMPEELHPARKITDIEKILNEIAQQEEIKKQFDEAMATGEELFNQAEYQAALSSFQRARDLMPGESLPKQKIEDTRRKLDEIAAAEALEKAYNEAVAAAEQFLKQELYESAVNNYKKAAELKPGEPYPKEKIAEVEALIAKNAEYADAISFADAHFNKRDWDNAVMEYKKANAIKPSEEYPLNKISEIEAIIVKEERQRKLDSDYNKAVAEADQYLRSKEYQPAITSYQQALALKPEETYPRTQIEDIRKKLETLEEEKQKAYELAITKADNFFQQENFEMAKLNYESASELKPGEMYPVDRLKEVNERIKMRRQVLQEEYDKAIADADKFFASKIYDNAIESYRQAAMIKTDEAYPVEMIRKILKLISERAIVDINREPLLIKSNTTERFVFNPVPIQTRKSNYIFFKATNKSEQEYKIILSFGEGTAKNGGVVVRVPPGNEENEYIVRISAQYKWFSEDNDWITMYPEGGDIEIGLMQITSSD